MTVDRVVIAGGGLAGLRTAEALRKAGFDGSVLLASDEPTPPYDRPPLSKEVLTGARDAADTIFRPDAHYADLAVDLRLGQRVTQLDPRAATVRVGAETVPFDRLVVATGSRPRTLPLGQGLRGVHVLRTLPDAVALRAAFTSRPRLVVVGAGFIGAEVASSARSLGLDVVIVEMAPTPLARVIGPRLGEVQARLHQDNATKLICGASLTAIHGNGRVEQVELSDGTRIDCDLVVVGVGAAPNVEWLAGSGLTIDDGLVCDDRLNAGHPAVFAVGDVVRWPNRLFGATMRTEQWTNAADQARHVARTLLGTAEPGPFNGSNYFWSDQYGLRIQFAGSTDADELCIVDGSTRDYRFLAYYRKGDRLVGAFAMSSAKQFARAKALIERATPWDEALAAAR